MTTDLFKTDPLEQDTTEQVPTFEDLVGEGKKYADQQAAAKAIYEKDRFIARLIQEAREKDEALAKRMNEDEFLTKLKEVTRASGQEQPVTTPAASPDGTAFDPAKIDDLLSKKLAEREAEIRKQQNLQKVEQELVAAFGPAWRAQVQSQAGALGVSTEYLTRVAADSPEAFLRLVGVQRQQRPVDMAPPRSQVNSQTGPTSNVKNYNYWKQQRAEKGEGWYFKQSTQREIWENLKALGEEAFYKP